MTASKGQVIPPPAIPAQAGTQSEMARGLAEGSWALDQVRGDAKCYRCDSLQ